MAHTIPTVHPVATAVQARTRSPLLVNEDWLAVWVGMLSLALVLAGARLELPTFGWASGADLTGRVLAATNLSRALIAGVAIGLLALVAVFMMQGSAARFALGFPVVFALACLAQLSAGYAPVAAWGLEYVIFAFAFGLVIGNLAHVPDWLREAARTEFYIKTGLVILGASILFGDLLQAGLLGIVQAVLVVTVVWFVSFQLAQRLRVDDELATMMASAVSICGVSAAIAACGAIQGDRKKLSYVTSLVLIVAAPMMVVMPMIVNAFDIPDLVGGAWLGGTLDTSASVVAAGEMVSEAARNAGVVVKLSQNVLIGVAAFLLTIWWAVRNRESTAAHPGLGVIWERFPKFVLGFLVVSLAFSFVVEPALVKETRGLLTGLRTMWFGLAFASIGLETRFDELLQGDNRRAAIAFLGGQTFNLIWTLILAYLLFGGILVAVPELS